MSDVHIKYLLARVEMSGSAIEVRGEEGPRNQWADLVDKRRARLAPCQQCGGHLAQCYYMGAWFTPEFCAVRAIEMLKAKR